MLASLENSSDYLLISQLGVRVPVTEALNLSTQLNVDYDNVPAAGNNKTDSALIFSLGYGF